MRALFILIIMLFLHVFADYHLQGILARLKQASNWPQTYNSDGANISQYRNDYKAALVCHSFEWSFVVMLPCIIGIFHACTDWSWPNIRIGTCYIMLLILNTMLHYIVDDMKANGLKLNLCDDQILHLWQLFVTWLTWTAYIGW